MPNTSATLYVVATPIGNLKDLSPRAQSTLQQVDWIAAEDTRNTGQLLRHLAIEKPLLAYHAHNERSATALLIQKLQAGESIALVSDAGTPGVSDPGSQVVAAALLAGIPVVPIPGPSAVVTLLSAAGFPPGPFLFYGFLPVKPGLRQRALAALHAQPWTLVFYEAPHRIQATLQALVDAFGGTRRLCIGRELTKLFETVHCTTLAEGVTWLAADPNHLKGEFVLAVEGAPPAPPEDAAQHDQLLQALLQQLSVADTVRIAMQATGAGRNALYQRALWLTQAPTPDNQGSGD